MSRTCIVLAGGKGLRLGRDKTSETISNMSLLKRTVAKLIFLDGDIIIVMARKQSLPQITDYPKLRVATDIYPDKGPLGGIYAGLVASDTFYNLVVACDMPFLNQGLLGYMVQLAADFDLVVPRLDNMVEPLHAVYSKDCLAPIERLIVEGNLSVYKLLSMVKARYVEAAEIDRFDPMHLSFFNINTEADLDKAKNIIEEK